MIIKFMIESLMGIILVAIFSNVSNKVTKKKFVRNILTLTKVGLVSIVFISGVIYISQTIF